MGERYCCYSFLALALDEVSGQVPCHSFALSPGKAPLVHIVGVWVGLRAELDAEAGRKFLCLCWGSNPGHPVSSEMLH